MKPKQKKSGFWKFLLSLYRPVRWLVFFMIITMVLSLGAGFFRNLMIRDIINQTDALVVTLIIVGVMLFAESAFRQVSDYARAVWTIRRQQPFIARKIFNDLNKKAYPFFTDNHSGKIAASVNEVSDYAQSINTNLQRGFTHNFMLLVTNLVMLFVIDFYIFLAGLVYSILFVLAFCVYFQKRYIPLIRDATVKSREYTGILNDAILNFVPLRVYNSVTRYSQVLEGKKTEAVKLEAVAVRRELNFYWIPLVLYLGLLGFMMWYAVVEFNSGGLSIGDLVFIITSMISLRSAAIHLGWDYIILSERLVKMHNCFQLLYGDNNIEKFETARLDLDRSPIEFRNVTFKYNKRKVFDNLNVTIQHGQKTGIIGVSGSGKTTFVNLLFRFYQPQSGQILIDDKDIAEYSTESLYDNICFVPQETILLHDTIIENIRIAKPTATEEEIIEATKKAELHKYIDSLENKYQTIVGERGIKLSGGQRQRIALARIFLRNAKIIVFDEATSSLDNDTEFKVQDNINKYFKNQTIICIAHRLTTLKEMDNVIVFKDGKIVEQGKPKDILGKY